MEMGPFVSLVDTQHDSTVAWSKWEEIKAQQGVSHAATLIGRNWKKPKKAPLDRRVASFVSSFNSDLFRSVRLRGSRTGSVCLGATSGVAPPSRAVAGPTVYGGEGDAAVTAYQSRVFQPRTKARWTSSVTNDAAWAFSPRQGDSGGTVVP